MRIGELAERAGISAKAIRYYEQIGVLGQPPRTAGGYRDYDQAALQRLGLSAPPRPWGSRWARSARSSAFATAARPPVPTSPRCCSVAPPNSTPASPSLSASAATWNSSHNGPGAWIPTTARRRASATSSADPTLPRNPLTDNSVVTTEQAGLPGRPKPTASSHPAGSGLHGAVADPGDRHARRRPGSALRSDGHSRAMAGSRCHSSAQASSDSSAPWVSTSGLPAPAATRAAARRHWGDLVAFAGRQDATRRQQRRQLERASSHRRELLGRGRAEVCRARADSVYLTEARHSRSPAGHEHSRQPGWPSVPSYRFASCRGGELPGEETKSRPRTATNQRFGTLVEHRRHRRPATPLAGQAADHPDPSAMTLLYLPEQSRRARSW